MYSPDNHPLSPPSSEWVEEEEDGLDRLGQGQGHSPPHPSSHVMQRPHYQNHQPHTHPASMSRSDPSYNIQGHLSSRFPPQSPPQSNGGYGMSLPFTHQGQGQQGQHHDQHGHHGHHTTPTDDGEEEAEDVLVWNTSVLGQRGHGHVHAGQSQSQHNRPAPPPQTGFPRSHSDIEDDRTILRKSKSIKSLGGVGTPLPLSEGILISLSNGNFISEEYENHMVAVTRQLEQIKTTQDSILSELSDDMSSLQLENVQLKNTNEHLTMQNSHLLQVITDLSNEVEHMRGVFRVRGWPMQQVVPPTPSTSSDKDKLLPEVGSNSKSERKQAEPEVSRKPSDPDRDPDRDPDQERRRSSRRSSSRDRESRQSSRPTDQTPAKFETISLSDDPSQEKVKAKVKRQQPPGPGDDQVAALAAHGHRRRSGSGERRKKSEVPKLSPISSDSFGERTSRSRGRGRGSDLSAEDSKQNIRSKSTSERINAECRGSVKGQSQGQGCFKNLFKRNKKRNETCSSDQLSR